MSTQPTAIFLAEVMESDPASKMHHDAAAAELRRLHAQRDALLEALQALYDEQEGPPLIRRHRQWQEAIDKTRAAIAAVEQGETK